MKPAREVRANQKKGRSGPYCSKSCAGRHSYTMPEGRSTHREVCKYGHPKDGWDTRNGQKYRKCLTCARERMRRARGA
jgi:hypothetical protein